MNPQSFSLDELVTALSLRVIHMVMAADEVIRPEESRFLAKVFPAETLERCGYVDLDEGAFTRRFAEAVALAPTTLRQALSKHERLGLLDLFFRACEADGDVDPREVGVVLQGARMLGIEHDDVVAHLSALAGEAGVSGTRGLEARRDTLAVELSDAPTAILTITQDQLHDCLGGMTTSETEALRQRVEAVIGNERGRLIVQTSAADLRGGLVHGWHALISALMADRLLLRVAGRLDLDVARPGDASGDLCEVDLIRAWMSDLLDIYPWLPAWVDPDCGNAAQLLATRLTGRMRDPDHVVAFLAAAVEASNYAAALTHRLGSGRRDHIHAFLAQFGMEDMPPGYFQGVDSMGDELDALGRRI